MPGTDVVQIGVPVVECSVTAADGFDPGFAINDVFAVVNREFAEENPAAARFLELVEIPLSAVNAAQIWLRDGEDTRRLPKSGSGPGHSQSGAVRCLGGRGSRGSQLILRDSM